ncbi:MAG: UDP-N-acetylmuramate--alanine ligase [Bacteroidetes bacterium]|jgi:UDP-N-acetylmuramate--alanine ligase|nr:UDP-N-acetylmuramate--alanine ligase [Bacteroidota bacterium]
MNIFNYKVIYFLGIGGIGMSALARYFNHYKIPVSGYDKTETDLTRELTKEGIAIHYKEDVEGLKSLLQKHTKEEVLIVYTPAVPKEHTELLYLQREKYAIQKRSQVLGEISKQFKTIAIAGTHGKTTTSSMVAHILKSAGLNCFAFLGGITKNYNTNLLLGDANDKDAYIVVEADEYDRSFLTLHPDIAVITSADADHLDIYGDEKFVHESYTLFANQVKENGVLIVNKNVDKTLSLNRKRLTYAVSLEADYHAENVHIAHADFFYDVSAKSLDMKGIQLGIPGKHNVENSIAAIAIAKQIGIDNEQIKEALRSFKGVKRRFDYRIKTDHVIYIDDYAHHPEELKATIIAAKSLYPDKKITGIFQPHLFSRTRDFADEFAASLDLLDETILLEIYPAREKPIEGVNSQMLIDRMKSSDKHLVQKENLIGFLKNEDVQVLLTMGAGDIDTQIEPIEQLLKSRS